MSTFVCGPFVHECPYCGEEAGTEEGIFCDLTCYALFFESELKLMYSVVVRVGAILGVGEDPPVVLSLRSIKSLRDQPWYEEAKEQSGGLA